MKFTLSWLKDHLETEASLDEIVAVLTRVGLEVEAVEDKALALKPFTIARVIEAKPHPNADRLRVCIVDTGAGSPVQVVCGAPNARTGMMGVFSPPGSYIPGKKITLGKGVIRGVESNGMLVSEAELEISDDPRRHHRSAPRRAARRALSLPMPGSTTRSSRSTSRRTGRTPPPSTASRETSRPPGSAASRRRRSRRSRAVFLSRAGASQICTRRCEAVPGLRASARARREMRSLARLHAAKAQGDRASPDQRAGRHHQLHDLRPRTAACTCSTRRRSRARSPCAAPRKARRSSRSTARPIRLDEEHRRDRR